MPVRNDTIFGPSLEGPAIFYGDVRKVADENIKLQLLKLRLETFFLNQVICLKNGGPFPLTIMTCIGIETAGEIFIAYSSGKPKGFRFIETAKQLDQRLSRKFTIEFKTQFAKQWPNRETEKIKNYSELLYVFFRNTMVHGYQAQGISLSFEDTEDWKLADGYVIMNPNWFWDTFRSYFESSFEAAISGQKNSPMRMNALKYFEKLLS